MAWRRSGDKPLSEPMMVSLLTHICVTRPQWVSSKLTHLSGPGYICVFVWDIHYSHFDILSIEIWKTPNSGTNKDKFTHVSAACIRNIGIFICDTTRNNIKLINPSFFKTLQCFVQADKNNCHEKTHSDIDGLVQNWSNSIADALELLQSCTKPSILLSTRYPFSSPVVEADIFWDN